MRNNWFARAAAVALAGAALAGAQAAHANVNPSLDGGAPVNLGGGLWQYTYTLTLSGTPGFNFLTSTGITDPQISSFFTFFDFAGYQTGSALFVPDTNATVTTAGGTWTVFERNATTGPGNPAFGFSDTTGGPNSTNIGLVKIGGSAVAATGADVVLGKLSLTSNLGLNPVGAQTPFTSVDQFQSSGAGATNSSSIQGPNITISVVPEAGTMGLLAAPMLGMVGMVAARRRRAK